MRKSYYVGQFGNIGEVAERECMFTTTSTTTTSQPPSRCLYSPHLAPHTAQTPHIGLSTVHLAPSTTNATVYSPKTPQTEDSLAFLTHTTGHTKATFESVLPPHSRCQKSLKKKAINIYSSNSLLKHMEYISKHKQVQ